MKENQQIRKEDIKAVFDSPYIKVADIQYAPGRHYYDATRRDMEELIAVKSDEEFRTMLPDAVSCIVILCTSGEEPKLLLSYEFRYPAGRYLLSVPAGLIDKEDETEPDPIRCATVREIKEETGLDVTEKDLVFAVNPLLFSTPGMTDESNALVCAVLENPDLSVLSQEGAVGSEQFDGFALLTREDALKVLREGRDGRGNFYPIYTWAALSYFVSDAWKA